jgi:hypothetical protein
LLAIPNNFRRRLFRYFATTAIVSVTFLATASETSASTQTSDPFAGQQWGLTAIGAPQVWSISQGAGVIVAVIDSGSGPHPDLAENMDSGRTILLTIESDGADDVDEKDGHGTHVAGIIGAISNNAIGIAGVAPKVRILPIHVLDAAGRGDSRDVARGIRYAADSGARVINLSLGGPTESASLTNAIQYAVDKGAIVIAASGNDGAESPPKWPAALDLTMAVTSTDVNNNVGIFAQRGDYIDIAAPGVGIISTALGNYKFLSGTSMSAAFVSGAAALLISAQPSITATQVRDVLMRTATDLGTAGRDTTFGVGLLNLPAAFAELALLFPTSVSPTLTTSGRIGDIAQGTTTTAAPSALLQWWRCTKQGGAATAKPTDCLIIKNAVSVDYQTTFRDLRKFLRFAVQLPTGMTFSPTIRQEVGVWANIQTVPTGSRTPIRKLIGTASRGIVSMTSMDKQCVVRSNAVIAPGAATTCALKVSVRRSAPFPALNFTLTLGVN